MVVKGKRSFIYEIVGRKIRKARIDAGFSQEELAKKLKLTRGSVAKIEGGKQSVYLHLLYSVAVICKIPLSELLPGDEWIVNQADDEMLGSKIEEVVPRRTAQIIKRGLDL